MSCNARTDRRSIRTEADPAGDTERLVEAVGRGDPAAWTELVRRYSPLLTAIARQHGLGPASVQDVEQNVWIRCLAHLRDLRDPAALPGWLKTTTYREAIRVATAEQRLSPTDPVIMERMLESTAGPDACSQFLRGEADQAVRDGLAELPDAHREMLTRMYAEPGIGYRELSHQLRMPTGSIGPTRARILVKLRKTTAVRRYFGPPTESATA